MSEDRAVKTPHDTLIEALEKVEEMGDVLVVYSGKDGMKMGSFDNDLSIAQTLFMLDSFKHWLMSSLFRE